MLNLKEIEDRIELNKKTIKKLEETYVQAFCPKSLGNTSYEDFNSIQGTRREYRVEDYFKAKQRLLALIELDKQLLLTYKIDAEDKDYLRHLENIEHKIKYLRKVRGYTQEKTAEILEMSDRQVRRIERKTRG